MAASGQARRLDEQDLYEWMMQLGVSLRPEEQAGNFSSQLRDGVVLCHLVNRLRPGSVEDIRTGRDSSSAEDNILHFLQACNALGVEKIFKLADLTDERRDFIPVLATLQELHTIAEGLGMGLIVSCVGEEKEQASPTIEEEEEEEEEDAGGDVFDSNETCEQIVRAKFQFAGENEDELVFDKGDIITVTKVVEGGWWEGVCRGKVGWFPGNYVEDLPPDMLVDMLPKVDKRSSIQQFYDMVISDVVESERIYSKDLQTLLSSYLVPLKSSSVLTAKEVDFLTGNLPEVSRFQQTFCSSLEESARLPLQQQNMGSLFLKASSDIEPIYTAYCANHPWAVAVLTENSDKLSAYMESQGAPSPGLLFLTTSLSKPFKRLEQYCALLKELQRSFGEEHPDTDNVVQCVDIYSSISSRTQDVRRKKDAEYEMLSSPVKGYNGKCLLELGDCQCVIQGNQALSAEEVEERFYLVFPEKLIILAVGASLSGYELKSNVALSTVSIKKGTHSDSWPWPVELSYGKITIHTSLLSEHDQHLLMGHVGGQVMKRSSTLKTMSSRSSMFRNAYPARMMRKTSAPITRAHHWGFMSLRPIPPLSSQQLMSLKERDAVRSPKAAKKFIYQGHKKRRSFKSFEDVSSVSRPISESDKAADAAILRVIEAYCTAYKRTLIPDQHSMPHRHSTGPGSPSPRSIPLLSDNTPYSEVDDFPQRTGSTSLSPTKPGPSSESWISKFTHLTTRVPSPTAAKTQKADKKGFLRKRSESFDAHTILSSKRTGF